jgi:hypothetical protein
MFGEQSHAIKISRQTLYGQVWATPMARLAKEYGISDVALAKICKKLNVPYPGRGYWRRKETGKAVRQIPLPPNSDPTKQLVTIHPTIRPDSLEPVSEETTQRITAEQDPEQKIAGPVKCNASLGQTSAFRYVDLQSPNCVQVLLGQADKVNANLARLRGEDEASHVPFAKLRRDKRCDLPPEN